AASHTYDCEECGPPVIARLENGAWTELPDDWFRVDQLVATSLGVVAVGDGYFDQTSGTIVVLYNGMDAVLLGKVAGFAGAAAERNGTICVGGNFAAIDAVPAMNVACWNGTAWAQAGDGLAGYVDSLAFTADGQLVAGGEFSTSGGANVAVLTNGVWNAVGGG